MKESLTVSVLWVCQFTSLVVFLWRLLISAECRLQFYCQHWWKEERERERVNCIAAKKEEFVIGWEWFQMVEQSMETPRVPASWPMCLLQSPWATESDTKAQWATVDKSSKRNEKLQCLVWDNGSGWFDFKATFLPWKSLLSTDVSDDAQPLSSSRSSQSPWNIDSSATFQHRRHNPHYMVQWICYRTVYKC